MKMSLTQKERAILEEGGYEVHRYSDGYVELHYTKTGLLLCYDAEEDTAYDGLKEFEGLSGMTKDLLKKLKRATIKK